MTAFSFSFDLWPGIQLGAELEAKTAFIGGGGGGAPDGANEEARAEGISASSRR